jgi:hypothetical protein
MPNSDELFKRRHCDSEIILMFIDRRGPEGGGADRSTVQAGGERPAPPRHRLRALARDTNQLDRITGGSA